MKFGDKLVRSLKLRCETPAGDCGAAVEDFEIFLFPGITKIARVLCPGIFRAEIGALEVHSTQLSALRVVSLRLLIGFKRGEEQLVRAGEGGRVEKGGAVGRVHTGSSKECLHSAVHKVASAGSVGVHIDESRAHVVSSAVQSLGIRRSAVGDSLYFSAVKDEDFALENFAPGDYFSVYK